MLGHAHCGDHRLMKLGKTLAVGFLALALDPRCQNHDSPAEERDGWA
jgi:hypothetical protein